MLRTGRGGFLFRFPVPCPGSPPGGGCPASASAAAAALSRAAFLAAAAFPAAPHRRGLLRRDGTGTAHAPPGRGRQPLVIGVALGLLSGGRLLQRDLRDPTAASSGIRPGGACPARAFARVGFRAASGVPILRLARGLQVRQGGRDPLRPGRPAPSPRQHRRAAKAQPRQHPPVTAPAAGPAPAASPWPWPPQPQSPSAAAASSSTDSREIRSGPAGAGCSGPTLDRLAVLWPEPGRGAGRIRVSGPHLGWPGGRRRKRAGRSMAADRAGWRLPDRVARGPVSLVTAGRCCPCSPPKSGSPSLPPSRKAKRCRSPCSCWVP